MRAHDPDLFDAPRPIRPVLLDGLEIGRAQFADEVIDILKRHVDACAWSDVFVHGTTTNAAYIFTSSPPTKTNAKSGEKTHAA